LIEACAEREDGLMDNNALQPLLPTVRVQNQMGPKDLLSMAIRRRWVIVCVAAPIILLSAFATFRSAEKVTASTRVMVEGREPESPEFSRVATNWEVVLSTAAQIAMSKPVAEKTVAILFDSLRVLAKTDPSLPYFKGKGGLLRSLQRHTDCHHVGESNILNISFTHTHPDFALLTVGILRDAYIEFSINNLRDTRAFEYYTDQINLIRAELDSLLSERANLVHVAGYAALEDNSGQNVIQIRNLETALYAARSDREAIEAKLNGIKKAVAADPEYVPISSRGESMYFQGLKQHLDKMKVELAKLRSQYQEDSEWVVRQKELVEKAREELLQARDNYIRDLEISVSELRGREDSYVESIQTQRELLATYPQVGKQVASLDYMISTQMDLLEAMQLKRGEVRLKTGADSRISNLIPLDDPAIQMRVVGSKKMLYLALSSVFALVLGFIVAWFVETQDHRIFSRVQAEQSLDVPVLGAISPAKITDRAS
jgi:uncharacterized protein involved in exopolysaccharide biosynthesis